MIYNYFPVHMRFSIKSALQKLKDVEEIRIRSGGNIVFCTANQHKYVDVFGNITDDKNKSLKICTGEIEEIIGLMTQNSIYAVKNELKNGFLTLKNGCRVGVCGRVVINDGEIQFIKNISSLNIRFSKQVKGCGFEVFKKIYTKPKNILIISPPGAGKTTLLREFIRMASDQGENVSVVDERCELAPSAEGRMFFDLGENTDILSDVPKCIGISMVLRSMNPKIIATDEIATQEDFKALIEASHSGVKIFATFHGHSKRDYLERVPVNNQINFDNFIYIFKDENGKRRINVDC